MPDNVEDLEERRRKAAEEEARRQHEKKSAETREMMDRFTEINKHIFAKEAFADAVVDILREVSRQKRHGLAGVSELARFFDMLRLGAQINVVELSEAVLDRLCSSREIGVHTDRERLLIDVAEAGLAYLVEKGARDGLAGARVSKRDSNLVAAIERFNEDQAAKRKAAQARRKQPSGDKRIMSRDDGLVGPPDNVMGQEIRKRIRTRAGQLRAKRSKS